MTGSMQCERGIIATNCHLLREFSRSVVGVTSADPIGRTSGVKAGQQLSQGSSSRIISYSSSRVASPLRIARYTSSAWVRHLDANVSSSSWRKMAAPSSSRRRPGSISVVGTGLRRCDAWFCPPVLTCLVGLRRNLVRPLTAAIPFGRQRPGSSKHRDRSHRERCVRR